MNTQILQYVKPDYSMYPTSVDTLEQVQQVVDTLLNEVISREHFQLIFEEILNGGFEIKLNNRLSATLGQCVSTTKNNHIHILAIEFNANYIKYERNTAHKIDTIIHEVMHALTDLEYNTYCGHDSRWKYNCKQYGCIPAANATEETTYREVMWDLGLIKYRLVCEECGAVLEYRKTMTTPYRVAIECGEYRCSECKSEYLQIQVNKNYHK